MNDTKINFFEKNQNLENVLFYNNVKNFLYWRVLKVKRNHEKKIALRFIKLGYKVFLPEINTIFLNKKLKKVRKKKLLFYSMIIINCSFKDRLTILSDPSSISFIQFNGKDAEVFDSEIDQLKFMIKYNHTYIDSFYENKNKDDLINYENNFKTIYIKNLNLKFKFFNT